MFLKCFKYATATVLATSLTLLLFGCGGGGGASAPPPPTYSISGKVTGTGFDLVNIQIVSATTAPLPVTTGAGGLYSLNVPNGTYTITSADLKYGFDPVSVTVAGASKTVNDIAAFSAFNITGKISLNGVGLSGVAVTLYKTSYTVYNTDGFYGTKKVDVKVDVKVDANNVPILDANGNEQYITTYITTDSLLLEPSGTITQSTGSDGTYLFNGMRSGTYTIKPYKPLATFLNGYAFNPDKTDVITVTDDGNVYFYDPTLTGTKVNSIPITVNSIIYNNTIQITGNTVSGQDFTASIPGGGGVIPCNPTPANNYCK